MRLKLIVGLRNPGMQYAKTRHNAGAWFVDALTSRFELLFKPEKKFHAEMASINLQEYSCKVLLPLVFMNQSGLPIRAACQFYQIEPQEVLVVHDELDLPPGTCKIKAGGGHGGHNGLRHIINQLGSREFYRLRIGIGHPGHKDLVTDYVLGKPSLNDYQQILQAITHGVDIVPLLLAGNIPQAMNQLNR